MELTGFLLIAEGKKWGVEEAGEVSEGLLEEEEEEEECRGANQGVRLF